MFNDQRDINGQVRSPKEAWSLGQHLYILWSRGEKGLNICWDILKYLLKDVEGCRNICTLLISFIIRKYRDISVSPSVFRCRQVVRHFLPWISFWINGPIHKNQHFRCQNWEFSQFHPKFITQIMSGWWLSYPSENYEFVNWDDDIPNISEHTSHVPNHQPVYVGHIVSLWNNCQ